MTTKEEKQYPHFDPSAAAFLAVHLVGQVLDEAYDIANAAKVSGQPWQCVSSLNNLRSFHLNELHDEDTTFTVSNGDSQYATDYMANLSNTVVTSTPQKEIVNATKSRNNSNLVGQGDEEFETPSIDSRKSPSMFINYLYDVSEVDKSFDETYISINDSSSDHNELLIKDMANIMNSCVNNALANVFGQESEGDEHLNYDEPSSVVTEDSSYSFLCDAYDITKDVSVKVNDGITIKDIVNDNCADINENKQKHNSDVAFYENAYLTLNRDYEQYSEEDELDLQDPQKMPLHEVELLASNKSSEDVTPCQVKTEFAVSEMLTSADSSRKSNLVRRCRLYGARLLSRLRGWWWRRKLPGKRKDPRTPGSIRVPRRLSPDARRRGASLLDQRNLRTPSPSTSRDWRFNTFNETLVRSSRWKEFGFTMGHNENSDFKN